MFERNRVDNSQEQMGVAVEIVLGDGEVAKGKFLIPRSRSVAEVLNGPAAFIEFEYHGGERTLIAKASLRAVKLVNVGRVAGLPKRFDAFDPHAILGVAPGASQDEVRKAYFARSKMYHPDRYASAELPAEVAEYLASMARTLNSAYAALESTAPRSANRVSGTA